MVQSISAVFGIQLVLTFVTLVNIVRSHEKKKVSNKHFLMYVGTLFSMNLLSFIIIAHNIL